MLKHLVTGFLLLAVGQAIVCGQNAQPFAERNPRYRLQPGDVIEVSYTYTPDYNQTLPIEPDGFATLKLIGSVKLSDLTLDQATDELKRQAGSKLNNPEITVVLKEYVKPHIVVSGEVNHPGSFDLHGKATAMEAIAWSGGFKDTSQQTQVLLIRRVDPEYAQVRVLDFKKLSSAKGAREDVELSPNDILVVPKSRLGKIEPYVRVASLGLTALYGVTVLK
jgi:polysaccharide biosynthesis/export protein